MTEAMEQALAGFRELGTAEEMWDLAAKGLSPSPPPETNLHVHLPPNFSAFASVAQAVELAERQGVRVLGASNYYHYGVYADFAGECRRRGVFPVFGAEIIALADGLRRDGVKINDPGNPGKMYLCAKGITRLYPLSQPAEQVLETIRRNDQTRTAEMIARMADVFRQGGLATGLDARAVKDMVCRRCGCQADAVVLQERHVAQAFQEAVFEKVPPEDRAKRLGLVLGAEWTDDARDPTKVQAAIRSHLMKAGKPGYVPETFVSQQEAYQLILDLRGIPCYPVLADGADPICAYEQPVERLIDYLKANAIYCVEFIPLRNSPQTLGRYAKAMRKAGLVVTAGTEHNTPDLVPMAPACAGGKAVPKGIREIFWEGACVVAAHQFLTLHGQDGFIDADGKPNEDYSDAERISVFAKLGAAVIQRYLVNYGTD